MCTILGFADSVGRAMLGIHRVLEQGAFFIRAAFSALSAPKSRDPLRLRRRFSPLPRRIARLFKAPRCAISSAKKIASKRRFSLRFKGPNLIPTAEFPAIPESAAKIASERRCAILVHSVSAGRNCPPPMKNAKKDSKNDPKRDRKHFSPSQAA